MAVHCDSCNRVLAKHVGMALLRTPCTHSTMYEHFGDFKRYKKNKEEDELVRKHKEELLKFSSTFTNFNLKRIISKDDFNQFSTKDIARYRRQIRMGNKDRLLPTLPVSPKASKVSKPQNLESEISKSYKVSPDASKTHKSENDESRPYKVLIEVPHKSHKQSDNVKSTKIVNEPPKTQRILYEISKPYKKYMELSSPKKILHTSPKSRKVTLDDSRPQIIIRKKTSKDKLIRAKYPKLRSSLVVRTPVNCAITCCNQIVGVTALFTHYVRDHSEDFGIQCQEIIPKKRAMLIFDPTNMYWRESTCLGVLAYGSKERKSCPAERGLCAHNSFLPNPYEHMDAHLAILIMANRTSWASFVCNRDVENRYSDPMDKAQEMIVIWFSSVKVTRPLHCLVTIFNKYMTACRSQIVRIRNLYEPQNPSEFVFNDANCVRLSHPDIRVFSHDFTESIYLEMFIQEYEEEPAST